MFTCSCDFKMMETKSRGLLSFSFKIKIINELIDIGSLSHKYDGFATTRLF